MIKPKKLRMLIAVMFSMSIMACGGGSSSGESNNDTADGGIPPDQSSDQPQVDEITILGFNWIYTARLSQCPSINAYFPTTQLESLDGVLINSWLRTNGNLVDLFTCAPANLSRQRVFVGGVGATDPLDRNEITQLITAVKASHYGIPPSSITVSELSVTADTISWTSTASGFGQTLSEFVTLTRGDQL